ncbi:MAG: IPT/TIG domain-containing protein [Acidobacteriota bacterium]
MCARLVRRGIHCLFLAITLAAPCAAASSGVRLSAMDILVTPPGFDDIGDVLVQQFGWQQGVAWTEIPTSSLGNYDAIKNAKVIFINCSTLSVEPGAATALRQFVSAGGALYASDWAYRYIQDGFPGYLQFHGSLPTVGPAGQVVAQIVDQGLRNYIYGSSPASTMILDFDLSWWAVLDRALRSDVSILLQGDIPVAQRSSAYPATESSWRRAGRTYSESQGLTSMTTHPLAVTFPYGAGRVVYTSFHNEAQTGPEEKRLIEYLVLVPYTTQLQNSLNQAFGSRGLSTVRTDLNMIDRGSEVTGTFYDVTAGVNAGIGLAWAGSTMRLSVYRPDGSPYAEQTASTSPVIVTIAKADASGGSWSYRVAAVDIPSDRYPFVVGIGTDAASGGPQITKIQCRRATPGSPATIRGTGFSATPGNNTVKFGRYKAAIKKASQTKLSVTIPTKCKRGTTYSVTVTVGGKTSNPWSFTVE